MHPHDLPRWLLFIPAFGVLVGSCMPLRQPPPDDYVGPVRAAADRSRPFAPAVPTTGPLELTLTDAALLALENNRSLRVERYNPAIRQTSEDQARAVFDPSLSAEVSGSSQRTTAGNSTGLGASVELTRSLPTGTDVSVGLSADRSHTSGTGTDYSTRAGISVTQALLRGYGLDVNLASIRQAELDTRSSEYELRGFAESLLGQIESAYWDYALARRQIEIYEQSLDLANRQLKETEQRIQVGVQAETERAAAEAEVALRQEGLINARSALESARLRLLRLLNPPGSALWQREITLKDQPTASDLKLDEAEAHVALALRMRPDLNQARLALQRGELEIVKTKNGLLPKLDLFITLGKTGYASSFIDSVGDMTGNHYDAAAGLRVEYSLWNRDADAQHRRATLSRDQAADALGNLAQLVEMDVRTAHVEAKRTREQVTATAATRKLQDQKLRAETEKFKVGKSTSLLVAQAQRDLLASQIAEVQAVVNQLKAVADLFRLDGSLLDRRGIAAPGRRPAMP